MAACGCGGDESAATAGRRMHGHRTPATAQRPANGAAVTGKLAPSLAPPATFIVLEPQDGAELPVKAEPAIMDQAGYEFLPAFLIAQAGQPVQFRNSEDVLHNVRVTDAASQEPVFNVATLAVRQVRAQVRARVSTT